MWNQWVRSTPVPYADDAVLPDMHRASIGSCSATLGFVLLLAGDDMATVRSRRLFLGCSMFDRELQGQILVRGPLKTKHNDSHHGARFKLGFWNAAVGRIQPPTMS